MGGRVYIRFLLLPSLQLLLCSCLQCAQLPRRLERCLPYPTLAQEIRAMQEETKPPEPEPSPSPRVVIASVQFAPRIYLPRPVRDRIARSIKSPRFYDDSELSWLAEMQDVGIRGALQDSGYFDAMVKVDARLIDWDEHRNRYALTLHIDEGIRYRLGGIRFVNAEGNNILALSPSDLRKHFPILRGDILNISKIRTGMEEITRLYGNRGYIDMVLDPDLRTDDNAKRVDIVMKIDEGKRYRVGKVEFLGLDQKAQERLVPRLRSGDVYNRSLIEELLKRNKTLLPWDVSWKDVQLVRNTKEGVIDLCFDFYTCPKAEHPTSSDKERQN